MRQSYHTPGGGMTSPAVSYRRGASKSPVGETMSPPVMRSGGGKLPSDWPKSSGNSGQPQATPAGYMASPSPVAPPPVSNAKYDSRDEREGTISISQYTQLQAERATVEVKLNTAENKLKDAESREQCLVNQLQRERAQHAQVCTYLLDACKSLSAKANLPDSVSSPGRASDFAEKLRRELQQAETDRELATAAAEAATAKIDQLTGALQNRDARIVALEAKLDQAHSRIETLDSEVHHLLDQLRIAQTSPVGPPDRSSQGIDDSLITWANTNETAVPPRGQPGYVPARSPARAIQTPSSSGNVNNSRTSTNPQDTTGEWPPSPRRQLNTSSVMDSTLNDTLPDEFPASPRRELPYEHAEPHSGPGEDWRRGGEEWPPSPRRGMQEQVPVNQQDWSNVTATPDQDERGEWPPSPQRSRGGEYMPEESPQRVRDEYMPEESPQRTRGEYMPEKSPQRTRGEYMPEKSPQRTRGEYMPDERTRGDEYKPEESPHRNRNRGGLESPPRPRDEYRQYEESPQRMRYQEDASTGEEWPPSPPRARDQEVPVGEEWPPSPPRARGQVHDEVDGYGDYAEYREGRNARAEEWPPSPQRNRSDSPHNEGYRRDEQVAEERYRQAPAPRKENNEWPPSPRRSRENEAPAPSKKDKEWPPSPRRTRISEGDVNQQQQQLRPQQPQPQAKKDVGHWPQSPRRTPPGPQVYKPQHGTHAQQSELKTPESLEKHGEPQYAESINMESPPQSPTPGTEPLEQTSTPVDAGNNISQKLEYPATSPKNQKRVERDELNDSITQLGGRRRSVGFVDVPSEPRRHSESSDVGAVRRSVDLIRDPSDLTPTAAKLRIAKLEREIRRIKGEPEHCSLDADMRRRAEKAFNAVDAMHQKDGSISKTELGKVLKEDPLGAKVLFHELDGDDSGEIDINEWLGWFNRLKSKDAAENMLEWIEERLEVVAKERGVHFSRTRTILAEETEARAKQIFGVILDKVNNEHFIYKPSLIAMLRDDCHVLRSLPTNDEQNVYVTQWMCWLEEIESSPHSSAASTLMWVESKLTTSEAEGGCTEYNGPLSESQRQRAVAVYHRLDEISHNTGTITVATLCDVLQMDHASSRFVLKELLAVADSDISMEDWINWFDTLERNRGSAADMLDMIESKLA